MKELIVVGMRDEIYQGKEVTGHNCDFEYAFVDKIRHVLLLKTHYNQKYELILWEEDGECGSGWCTASFGYCELKEVTNFAGKTHKIISEQKVVFDESALDIETEVFTYSDEGGDGYYPSGHVWVNYELFEKIENRGFDKRPVLVFYGDSNSMKSHLAALTGKFVYETDYELGKGSLPDIIVQDIVVIGNKYQVDLDDVKSRLVDCEVIEVNFKRTT